MTDKDNITIIGESTFGQNRVVINGDFLIEGCKRIGISNIQFDASLEIDYSVSSGSELIYLDNVTVVNPINISLSGYSRFDRCFLSDVTFNGGTDSNNQLDLRNCQFESGYLTQNGESLLTVFDTTGICFVHNSGNAFFTGYCMFTYRDPATQLGIVSTAGQEYGIRIDGGTMMQASGDYANLNIPYA